MLTVEKVIRKNCNRHGRFSESMLPPGTTAVFLSGRFLIKVNPHCKIYRRDLPWGVEKLPAGGGGGGGGIWPFPPGGGRYGFTGRLDIAIYLDCISCLLLRGYTPPPQLFPYLKKQKKVEKVMYQKKRSHSLSPSQKKQRFEEEKKSKKSDVPKKSVSLLLR